MIGSSKHAFAVLVRAFRSPAGRRLATALVAAIVITLLPGSPPRSGSQLHLATVPAASGGWLDRTNAWRASTRLTDLGENATWSAGDYDHALYMVKNDLVTHYETVGTPYYTVAGDTAARNSNIYISSSTSTSDVQAIDWWMQAPFHAMGLMDPRLTTTGFGSYRQTKSGWQMGAAVDVLRGNSFTGGQYPVYFPGNGSTEPLLAYGGGEFPDPLQGCSGYTAPTGLPVFVQVGGNVATTAGSVHSFTGNKVALAHCVIDSTNPAVGRSLIARGGVIVIPRQPLQTGVTYTVALTVNAVPYSWSFTVGPFITTVTAVSPATGSGAGGTAVTITGSGFSNGYARVKFGTTPASSVSVLNDRTITAVAPAHAAGMVDVTVTAAGGTSAVTAADQYTFTQPPCSSVALSSNKTSPQPGGTAVTFTAIATGPACPSAVYEFWLWSASGGWVLEQAYSAGNTWTLDTTGMRPGTYSIDAWAEEAGSTVGSGSYETFGLEAWTVGGCDGAALTPNPASGVGPVTFTATTQGAGCTAPLYEYWLWSAASGWVLRQPYSATATWSLNTGTLAAGTYTIDVWAKQQGSPLAYETWALSTLPKSACGVTTISPVQASPQPAGGIVSLSTTAAGCSSPEYRYWIFPGANGGWQMLRDYGAASFDWNTAGLKPGTYSIDVHVRQSNSTAAYDTFGLLSYSVSGSASTSLGASPASPQALGTAVKLTASAPGSAPQYQVWMYPPGGPWTMVQDFSANPTIDWATAGMGAATYAWVVYTRQSGSGNAYDSYALLSDSLG